MKKRIIVLVTVILLLVMALVLYVLIPCFPVLTNYFDELKWSWENREPTAEQMKKYYDKLTKPTLTSEKVIAKMQEDKGLYNDNTKLCQMVEWYVYNGNIDVIRQLIANLEFEVERRMSKEDFYVSVTDTGRSYSILKNQWDLFPDIGPVLHEELHKYAAETNMNYKLIDNITALISQDNRYRIKINNKGKDIIRVGGKYTYSNYINDNFSWYTDEIMQQDILAYLRIYAASKSNDRYLLRDSIHSTLATLIGFYYIDSSRETSIVPVKLLDKLLMLADEKGAESAYEHYLENRKNKIGNDQESSLQNVSHKSG